MKARNIIILSALLVFVFCLFLSPSATAAQEKEKEDKTKGQIIIPKEVKVILQEGLAQHQSRLDIPFAFIKHLYLPAQLNMHSIFLFKMKNVDLGFAPQAFDVIEQKTTEEKTEEKKTETPPASETETPPALLQANLNVFLQFYRLEEREPVEVIKEVYIPVKLQVERTSYDPEKEEIYTTAYPLPPGDYLLAMALTSPDIKKIGTQYYEFSLPDSSLYTETMETTPLFFIKSYKQMSAPETTAEVHKDFFTYSIRQIEPKIDNVFPQGEDLDIFFYIYGIQPNEENQFDIGVNYEVSQEEENIIRFEPITYPSPLVSQPLPMKRTFRITSEEGEKSERRDLDPGQYTLSIKIKDNISGKSLDKKIDFEIK
jgi:hypothetical protein